MTDAIARTGTIIGFDWGERFIGVAVGERLTGTAHSLATIVATRPDLRFAAIGRLIDEWQPGLAVVGVPVATNGGVHALAARALRFARQIEGRFRLPFALVNEHLSSATAAAELARAGHTGRRAKDDVHAAAAQVILQSYLEDPARVIDPATIEAPS